MERIAREFKLLNVTVNYLRENLDEFNQVRLRNWNSYNSIEEFMLREFGEECKMGIVYDKILSELVSFCEIQLREDILVPICLYWVITYNWRKIGISFDEVINLFEKALEIHENKDYLNYYLGELYLEESSLTEDLEKKLKYADKGGEYLRKLFG